MIIGHHNILIFDVLAIGKLSFFIAESSAMFGYLHFWLWINYLPTLVGFFQKEKMQERRNTSLYQISKEPNSSVYHSFKMLSLIARQSIN